MTRLATILIGAWVLWVEGFDLTSQTTVYAPKPLGAYPTKGDEACMAERVFKKDAVAPESGVAWEAWNPENHIRPI